MFNTVYVCACVCLRVSASVCFFAFVNFNEIDCELCEHIVFADDLVDNFSTSTHVNLNYRFNPIQTNSFAWDSFFSIDIQILN